MVTFFLTTGEEFLRRSFEKWWKQKEIQDQLAKWEKRMAERCVKDIVDQIQNFLFFQMMWYSFLSGKLWKDKEVRCSKLLRCAQSPLHYTYRAEKVRTLYCKGMEHDLDCSHTWSCVNADEGSHSHVFSFYTPACNLETLGTHWILEPLPPNMFKNTIKIIGEHKNKNNGILFLYHCPIHFS